MKKIRKAFTLTEIMIAVLVAAVLSVGIHSLVSGSLFQFSKNYGKLSNMRTATLVFERLKRDMRASLPYSSKYADKNLCEIPDNPENPVKISFYANLNKTGAPSSNSYARVTYEYIPPNVSQQKKGVIKRIQVQSDEYLNPIGSPQVRQLNTLNVTDFQIEEKKEGVATCIRAWLTVQGDEGVSVPHREKDKFQLSVTMYPKFFENCVTTEERTWNH